MAKRKSKSESRNVENPAIPISNAAVLAYVGDGSVSDAGVTVNESVAMGTTAVWAAVQLLAGAIGTLPMDVFERRQQGGRISRGDHPIARLLALEPNEHMTWQVFGEALMANILLYGAGFVWIAKRGPDMRPRELLLLPSRITHIEARGGVTRVVSGGVELRMTEVLYIPGLSLNGLVGLSPINYGKGAIGLAVAAEQQASSFFANGSRLSGFLEAPKTMSKEALERLRMSWEKLHSGAKNAFRTAILEEGLQFKSATVPPEAAQMLESRKFQVTEVARIFGVPPHMLADLERATFSNIEHQAISFVTYSLMRWVRRIEGEFDRKLFREDERGVMYTKLNPAALLRGDHAARGEFYTKMFNIGVFSINEIRCLEDHNPIEHGDEHYRPLNMQPITPAPELPPEPPQDPPEDPPADPADPPADPAADDADAVRQAWRQDVEGRIQHQITDQVARLVRRHLFGTPDVATFRAKFTEQLQTMQSRFAGMFAGPLGQEESQQAAAAMIENLSARIQACLLQDDPGDAVMASLPQE